MSDSPAAAPAASAPSVAARPGTPGTPGPTATGPTGPSSPAAARPSAPTDEGSAKETIESILVAFILAFIFRAFIVEAFVIPTGSMAPTLLGAHLRYRCDDCGYRFDVNYSGRTVGDDVEIPSVARGRVYVAFCPNCGLKVPRENPRDPENDATAPPVHYGDRILVLKYTYLLEDPKRWDVVVFKTPDRLHAVPPFTMNYIKRLVGLPGDSLFVLDGDLYAGRHGDPLDKHAVQTKSRIAQEALWRIVYDNDFQAARDGWTSPWQPETPGGAGWQSAPPGPAARVLSFDNAAATAWLRFDPDTVADKQTFTDWLAYAVTKPLASGASYDQPGLVARNTVSDLKLSLFYERKAGDGPLRLELTKLDDVFTAELSPGKVRLLRRDVREPADADREIAAAELDRSSGAGAGAGPLAVEFMNVDYQVTVRLNGRDVLQTTGQQYGPNVPRLLSAWKREQALPRPKVRIGAERQTCALSHVTLWRDIYYTNRDHETGRLRWGTPERPMELAADQYWTLGDNSLMSGDGRYWDTPIHLPAEDLDDVPAGIVPARFMLGKAFFVYWPAGYRPQPSLPGLVPNFAEMRFIH